MSYYERARVTVEYATDNTYETTFHKREICRETTPARYKSQILAIDQTGLSLTPDAAATRATLYVRNLDATNELQVTWHDSAGVTRTLRLYPGERLITNTVRGTSVVGLSCVQAATLRAEVYLGA